MDKFYYDFQEEDKSTQVGIGFIDLLKIKHINRLRNKNRKVKHSSCYSTSSKGTGLRFILNSIV